MGMKELEVLEEAPKVPTHISAPHRLDSAIKEVTENHPHPETGKANPTPPSKARHTSPQKQSDYKPRHEWMGSGSSAIDNAFHVGSPAESPGGLPRQAPGHNVHPPPMSPMMSMRRAPADKGDEDEFYI